MIVPIKTLLGVLLVVKKGGVLRSLPVGSGPRGATRSGPAPPARPSGSTTRPGATCRFHPAGRKAAQP